jgi:tetratricopeptide (TPR) repeat protein
MRKWIVLSAMMGSLWAETAPEVEQLFLPVVKEAAAPEINAVPSGITMAVSSASDEAQRHVVHGLNLIHGGWDFEAYRHFVAALKLDSQCLMAHFGVVLCLLDSDVDYEKPRIAAAERAVSLVEAGVGSDLERGYLFSLMTLLESGTTAGAEAFARVALKYPQDRQLKLFQSYFLRNGFDVLGSPRLEQQTAQSILQDLLKKEPDSPLLMNAWLMIRAESPKLGDDLQLARKLCQKVPGYAPYQHLLGHYEWRSGNHREAAMAFSRSGELYVSWMKQTGIGITHCSEWIRAESYRAMALASSGDYDSALAAARALAKVSIPEGGSNSTGARMLWWEACTLEARLLLRRGKPGDMAKAMASLPAKEVVRPMAESSKVVFFYQGLAMLLDGKKALEEKNMARVDDMVKALSMHLPLMDQARRDAANLGELSAFLRGYAFLDISLQAFKGDIAMAKTDGVNDVAFNWYSSAAEKQSPASRLMPPHFLKPMQRELGLYFVSKKDFASAKQMYEEGLAAWPRDISLLRAKLELQRLIKDETSAAATEALIREVVGEK